MGWSRHAPRGLTFAQARAAEAQSKSDKHDSQCDCDRCCWDASQAALAKRSGQ